MYTHLPRNVLFVYWGGGGGVKGAPTTGSICAHPRINVCYNQIKNAGIGLLNNSSRTMVFTSHDQS